MNASRRQFVQGIGIFGALFLGRSLMACAVRAGEAVGESGEALATCGDAVIGNNHGHSLQVSPEDVAAGVEKTYSIKGASSHDHRVTLTAADFAALAIGTSITVSASPEGAFVRFAVADQGPGIPEHARQMIFEPFRQIEGSDSRRKGGSGLGLSICKAIVELHGGSIGVSSPPAGGSVFHFTIPIVAAA